jgi:hypothetical protein
MSNTKATMVRAAVALLALVAACSGEVRAVGDAGVTALRDAASSAGDGGIPASDDAGHLASDATSDPSPDATSSSSPLDAGPLAAPIARGEWTRLDTGGGPSGAYFYRSVVIAGGDIWMSWAQPASAGTGGCFLFEAATNTWRRTNEVNDDPSKNIGSRENYGAWYDPDRHAVWISDGAPVAYGAVRGAQSGDLRYDVATDTFTLEFPNYGEDARALGRLDAAFVYHGDVLYRFGGWDIGGAQALDAHDLITDEIYPIATASTPVWTEDPARLSYARSGVDSRTGELWTLADGGELYVLDPSAASPEWTHVPTTGESLGAHRYGAALHEAANTIVAYVGLDSMIGGDSAADLGDTMLLDLETREWRYGPRLSLGDTVPRRMPLAVHVMNYDAANERVVITVSTDLGTQVWAYTPPPTDG